MTAGLKTATRSPVGGERAGDHRGDDGLADLGAGAGDEDARAAVGRLGGEASRAGGARRGAMPELAGRGADEPRGALAARRRGASPSP